MISIEQRIDAYSYLLSGEKRRVGVGINLTAINLIAITVRCLCGESYSY